MARWTASRDDGCRQRHPFLTGTPDPEAPARPSEPRDITTVAAIRNAVDETVSCETACTLLQVKAPGTAAIVEIRAVFLAAIVLIHQALDQRVQVEPDSMWLSGCETYATRSPSSQAGHLHRQSPPHRRPRRVQSRASQRPLHEPLSRSPTL